MATGKGLPRSLAGLKEGAPIVGVSFDEATSILTFTRSDGSTFEVDLSALAGGA